jgi:hypothetical protein
MQAINSSEYAEPGVVVCTRQGAIVWVGPVDKITAAGEFDTVHCHDDDVETILRLLQPPPAKPTAMKRRPKEQD